MHIVLHAHACVLYYMYVHDDVMLVYAHCAKFDGNMTSLKVQNRYACKSTSEGEQNGASFSFVASSSEE